MPQTDGRRTTDDRRRTTDEFWFHELCWHSQAELKMKEKSLRFSKTQEIILMYDGKLFFQNLAFILLTASEKTRMDAHPFHYITFSSTYIERRIWKCFKWLSLSTDLIIIFWPLHSFSLFFYNCGLPCNRLWANVLVKQCGKYNSDRFTERPVIVSQS